MYHSYSIKCKFTGKYFFRGTVAAVFAAIMLCQALPAVEVRVYEEGQLPNDVRLQPLKDLNGYFPFQPPATREQWNRRAAEVRQQLMVANGLYPLPEKTPLNAVIHGKIEQEDYTVEKVFFESLPGFFVTGNLYRPKNLNGKKVPGILCPHGHWLNGRFYDAGDAEAKQQVEIKAEMDLEAAHSPLQARAVHLARMGCTVFFYDMIGYADSQQISSGVAHGFAKQRPEMNTAENWGLFSTQAETHLQSVMGLQTYNSIRSLDFLETLPEVDSSRLGVTGASGGGTQTMILAAVDPRVAAAFPAVMVSTAMQGGCTCENCSLLRVNTGNIEFAALFAPKPQGMSAANDWTKEMTTKGFPELKKLYELLGAGDKVHLISRIEFDHNYNAVCRRAMYELFNEAFDLKADINERPFPRLTTEQMTVWNDSHKKPAGGEAFERELLSHWNKDSQRRLDKMNPTNAESFGKFHDFYSLAVHALIGRDANANDEFDWHLTDKVKFGEVLRMTGKLRNNTRGEELPMLFLHPVNSNGEVVIWPSDSGKKHLLDGEDRPTKQAQKLLDAGYSLVGVDLLFQGEYLKESEPVARTRKVAETREAAAYTFGYNDALFMQRVHDLMSVTGFSRTYEKSPAKKIHIVGLDGTGPLVAVARAVLGDKVDSAVVNTGGFRFGKLLDFHDVNFMPGGAKYNDLLGFLAMSAPNRLWLTGEGDSAPELVARAFQAAGKGDALKYQAKIDAETLLDWLKSGDQ